MYDNESLLVKLESYIVLHHNRIINCMLIASEIPGRDNLI